MPTSATLLTVLAALLVLEITPGPDMMLVLARGIGQGRRTALLTVFGMVVMSGAIQISLLILGVASLTKAYPTSLVVLKWLGAAYLLYLGARMLWTSRTPPGERKVMRGTLSDWAAVREGCLNNLTNPKSLIFMFAFLPQFTDPAAGPIWSQLLILGIIQKATGILSLVPVALAAGTLGQWLHQWPRLLAWQERFSGTVMLVLGLRVAIVGTGTGR